MWLWSYTLPMARERFQDNLRLVLGVTGGLLLLFLLAELLLRKSRDFQPDFLASALLYGLTVLNFSLLLVLVFVLGRNLVRMLMEWRRGVFGARLRVQLLLVFLLMAIAPSLLILLVGSDLLRQTVDRWFNVDAERMLSSSQSLGLAVDNGALETSRVHARQLASEIEAPSSVNMSRRLSVGGSLCAFSGNSSGVYALVPASSPRLRQ